MKTIAYLDCPTGISGDMCLGALVDAGVPLAYLQAGLDGLGLSHEFQLSVESVIRQGQAGTRVVVTPGFPEPVTARETAPSPDPSHPHHHPPVRHLQDIEMLILQAHLPDRVTQHSLAIFRQLGIAEAAVHGISIDQVHFHEVGATDAIVDIVGTCLGLDWLGIEQLVCSALPTGSGRVKAAHGWLPVPAPAVLRLLQMAQVPIYSNGLEAELVTPTGAAIATTLADRFGPPPAMTLQTIGLGAGGRDLPYPNLLRLWIGTTSEVTPGSYHHHSGPADELSHAPPHPPVPAAAAISPPQLPDQTGAESLATGLETILDPVVVLTTQVDDLIPQAVGYLYERLFAVGALDVFTQAIGMKKSRPGLLITVICPPATANVCEQVLFAETTTLGIRRQTQQRSCLQRRFQTVTTPFGPIQIKLADHPETGQLLNAHPEYEDCAAAARQHRVPWKQVYQSALGEWYRVNPPTG